MAKTQDSRQETPSDAAGVDVLLARHGGLSYLEIPAMDARRSAAFYQCVFGWKLRDEDADQPKFSDQTGHLIGRWVTGRAISWQPGLLPYIYVDHIDDVVNRFRQMGERLSDRLIEREIYGFRFRDPAGIVVGVWQEHKP